MVVKSRKKAHYILFLLSSLVLHLVLFYGFILFSDHLFFSELHRRLDHKITDKTQDLSVQIELIDLKENSKQIVELKDLNKKKPDEAEFLSQDDQSVEKQSKAALSGAFKNSSSSANAQAPAPPVLVMIPAEKMMEQSKKASPSKKLDPFGLQGAQLDHEASKILKNQEALLAATQPQNSQQNPSLAAEGPSQTDDYLEGIEEGQQTLLNTKKFRFYTFYHRVKGQLRSHWNPLIREEVSFIFATKRKIASLDKKRTSLRVTLDAQGYLEEIEILSTSGNKRVDLAAIQAFRQAAPFPNPPKELLEKDKKIRLLWDFILES